MNGFRIIVLLVLLFSGAASPSHAAEGQQSNYQAFIPMVAHTMVKESCHFGVGIRGDISQIPVASLGFGSYVNWSMGPDPAVPDWFRHFPILRVGDNRYFTETLPSLQWMATYFPSNTWIVGNEPDSQVSYQDNLSPEMYAERYYEVATQMRSFDPTAKLGFGSVIQPSAMRLYYLDRALDRLAQLAGGRAQAFELIDVYTIHGFILNEQPRYTGLPNDWGAGVPVGYDPKTWPSPYVIRLDLGESGKTHDIEIFKERVIGFRKWMQSHGEHDKPLWITEYGSLFPMVDIGFILVSEEDTAAFMEQTFDFMLGYKDPSLGTPSDDFRLVQSWIWYSLDENLRKFGGSLYNPETMQPTFVGQRFSEYDPPLSAVPVSDSDVFIDPEYIEVHTLATAGDQAYYQLTLRAGNRIKMDRRAVVSVDIYEGTQKVAEVQAVLPRCGGTNLLSVPVGPLTPGETHTYSARIRLQPGNGADIHEENNAVTLPPVKLPGAKSAFIPFVNK